MFLSAAGNAGILYFSWIFRVSSLPEVVQIVADLATDEQHVSWVLMAVTAAAIAGMQKETAEMAGVLVQKVAVVQHSAVLNFAC